MGRLAVVGGHSVLGAEHALAASRVDVQTEALGGKRVAMLDAGAYVLLQRHGLDAYTPPHRIDHVANARALAATGVDRVLAIGSCGSLRLDHPVGSFVAIHDFIALDRPPPTAFDDERGHVVASIDDAWRARLLTAWPALAGVPLVDRGVYWETTGPRFETAAEIRFMAGHADVVGMTLGAECTAVCEQGLAYAAVCIVDNLANGLREEPLTLEEFEAGTAANRALLLDALEAVLPELAE